MTTKRLRHLALAAAVLAALCLAHAPILRGLAGLLIVDQPVGDFQYVCIAAWGYGGDGDRCYEVAGDLYRDRPSRRVLLIEPALSRVEQIGAMASSEATSRRQLEIRGVPQDAISLVRGGRWNDSENARALAGWLGKHAGGPVVLLCDQFRSATVRHAIDAVFDPVVAARVHVRPLRNRDFDETNWWLRRCGYREFAAGWLLRIQSWLGSGDAGCWSEKNADVYERDFLKSLPHNAS